MRRTLRSAIYTLAMPCLLSTSLPVNPAYSATVEELKRYDFNNSGKLFDDASGRELQIYTLHNQKDPANAALRKYDLNNNGLLESAELTKLYSDPEFQREVQRFQANVNLTSLPRF